MKAGFLPVWEGVSMDIRSAQKIAWNAKLAPGINTDDVSSGFDLLSGEVAKAFDTWVKGRREMAEELASIAIFLLRLAEMVGTDLQAVVEAKLAVSVRGGHGQSPDEVPVRDPVAAAAAAMNHGKL